jgi:hypothetical protein
MNSYKHSKTILTIIASYMLKHLPAHELDAPDIGQFMPGRTPSALILQLRNMLDNTGYTHPNMEFTNKEVCYTSIDLILPEAFIISALNKVMEDLKASTHKHKDEMFHILSLTEQVAINKSIGDK